MTDLFTCFHIPSRRSYTRFCCGVSAPVVFMVIGMASASSQNAASNSLLLRRPEVWSESRPKYTTLARTPPRQRGGLSVQLGGRLPRGARNVCRREARAFIRGVIGAVAHGVVGAVADVVGRNGLVVPPAWHQVGAGVGPARFRQTTWLGSESEKWAWSPGARYAVHPRHG